MRTTFEHPELERFAALAKAFCEVLEGDHLSPYQRLHAVHRLLPTLYASALQLPDTSVLFPDDDDRTDSNAHPDDCGDVTPMSLPSAGLSELVGLLGPLANYREIFDPHDRDANGEVAGNLFDDLSDIYSDLARGLVHWRAGASGAALWEWRFNFQIHWGEHATSALRALYTACAWHDMTWPAAVQQAVAADQPPPTKPEAV